MVVRSIFRTFQKFGTTPAPMFTNLTYFSVIAISLLITNQSVILYYYDRNNSKGEYMEKYLTVKEVAIILSVTRICIYNFVKRGLIKSIKFGRTVRISESSVNAFIQSKIVN